MANEVEYEDAGVCPHCGSPRITKVVRLPGDGTTMAERRITSCQNPSCPGAEDTNEAAARVVREATEGK
jgi:hypothetical protein